MSVEIVYETHSISEDNERGIATGWLDGRLSEQGRHLARELGRRRGAEDLAIIFTSDLGRAVETAEIAFAGSGVPVIHDARLRECNYGRMNGAPVKEVHAQRLARLDEPYPEGESYRQATARMTGFLEDLGRGWEGRRVLLIGHVATRWALDHLLDGVPLERLAVEEFAWRPGWSYTLPTGWRSSGP